MAPLFGQARDDASSVPAQPALGSILDFGARFLMGAMRATIHGSLHFNAMANNFTMAMCAARGKGMNGALETIIKVAFPCHRYLEGLVIFIHADFATSHVNLFSLPS
jgi:hypothetical protein